MSQALSSRTEIVRGPIRFKNRGASLGMTATTTDELIRQLERGLSFKALKTLETLSGVGASSIAAVIGIPERTFARRKAAGRLSPEESERLFRISTVFEKAVELFEGDVSAAVSWLMAPRSVLGNRSPLTYSWTEVGAREVESLIGRLEQG